MKKSQFEEMLFDAINALTANISDSDINTVIDEVLKVIDKVGMTPPPIGDSVTIVEQDGQLLIPIWGWEEE